MARIFDTGEIIECVVDETDFLSLMFKIDIDDNGTNVYPDKDIIDMIFNALPEYVFADYEQINNTNATQKMREAAHSLYQTEAYQEINKYLDGDDSFKEKAENHKSYSRGEFGEILLHILLRDFKETIPLVSKVYFKDSTGVPAHGFDCVHFSQADNILWLGESKLYTDGKRGVDELIKDLKDHFNHDFLSEQFNIIKKNVNNNSIPNRDYWIEQLSKNVRLKDMVANVNVPLLCVYSDDAYKNYLDSKISDINSVIEQNTRDLKTYFDTKNNAPLKSKLNIILFLFPVKDKHEFVLKAHERLRIWQNI